LSPLGNFLRTPLAVKHSFPALAQHFQNASKNVTRESAEKARFQGLLFKLALMADVFNVKKLVRSTTKPKCHTAKNPKLIVHTIIESLIVSPGEHSILAQLAEEAMSFQDVQLREGRGPIINQAQSIRAVADNMKQLRLSSLRYQTELRYQTSRCLWKRNPFLAKNQTPRSYRVCTSPTK